VTSMKKCLKKYRMEKQVWGGWKLVCDRYFFDKSHPSIHRSIYILYYTVLLLLIIILRSTNK
jgi:hypothetical protein